MTIALDRPAPARSTAQHRAPRRARLARLAQRWHRRLGWLGGLALLLFGLSGLTHPLMTWFGPQAAAFFPPQAQVEETDLTRLPPLLQTLHDDGLERASVIKLVPTESGQALQVTPVDQPQRRYFALDSGAELNDFDRRQAEWLARYYTGLTDTPLRELTLQTEFDHAYPEVNRLLPVWKVTFDTDDGRTAFIHTELNALASLTNNFRTTQQGLFRTLHTLSWLDAVEPVRVFAMAALCLALILMSLTGIALVLALPARTLPHGQRRWHRWLALGLWLPLLAFSASGLYHLLHQSAKPALEGLRYAAPLELDRLTLAGSTASMHQSDSPSAHTDHVSPNSPTSPTSPNSPHNNPAAHLNSVTLLQGPDGAFYFRLGQPNGRPGEAVHHHGRFDGTPIERVSPLLHVHDQRPAAVDEKTLVRHFAAQHLQIDPAAITDLRTVTRFGPEYDFRNKRLPVWRVQHADGIAFIDPTNGALVERVAHSDRWEGFSFSHLHKWNFLTPLTGRELRDGLVATVILAALAFTGLGFAMLVRRRPRTRSVSGVQR